MSASVHKTLAAAALVLYCAFAFWGMMQIPFHPDETSFIYQSRDLEVLLSEPMALAWDPASSDDYDQQYRALNAPLAKYVIAIGRRLAGYEPERVSIDWNWGKSWQENMAAGALPDHLLLQASRSASTIFLPLSLVALTACGSILGGKRVASLAAFLFALNALVLVHQRRAMSEGVMAFGVCLAILGMLHADRRPWLAALGAGLAFNTKYSTAPFLFVNLVACLWIRAAQDKPRSILVKNFAVYVSVLLIVVVGLNPFLWSNPVKAAGEMWQARRTLVNEQVETLQAQLPGQVLDTLTNRFAALIGNLFLSPPQFAEVGNYLAQTNNQQEAYLSFPLHRLFRGNLWGGLLLVFTIFGFIISFRDFAAASTSKRRIVSLLAVGTLAQAGALLMAVPLPFQRYYLPLIPFVCLWTALGLSQLSNRKNGLPMERQSVKEAGQ